MGVETRRCTTTVDGVTSTEVLRNMSAQWDRVRQRVRPAVTLTVVAAAVLANGVIGSAAAQQVVLRPHWGPYQWSGGAEKAAVRAFWIFDRTGDQRMNDIIKVVADAWNNARTAHPELPYVGVVEDDGNAGGCFVNKTPGFSVASACLIPENIEGVRAIAARNPDSQGHLIGAAFAISDGLTMNEAFTAVCHALGHVMGLENSDDPESCMSHEFAADTFRWYSDEDGEALLQLYDHSDAGGPSTTSASSTSSSSTPSSTTATSTSSSSTTTVASTTSSSSTSSTTSSTTSTSIPLTIPTVPLLQTTTTGGSR